MNATYIGLLERGRNVLSLETIIELADVLGADVGEIMREVAGARLIGDATKSGNSTGS